MNFLLVLIALLLVIAIIFKIIVIIGALTRNKESVSVDGFLDYIHQIINRIRKWKKIKKINFLKSCLCKN